MQERGVGKPWTAEEDSLLTQAVAVHGEVDNWKTVALSVPGRTNKACRKRWLHSLSPSVKKTAWTAEEDRLLLSLYAAHGTKWAVIARSIPGRTDDACSKRYREALDPSLKRDDWTAEEDARLLGAHARLGGRWGLVGQELNRSGLACRNRWRMMERKKAAGGARQFAAGNSSSPAATAEQVRVSQPTSWNPPDVGQFWDAAVLTAMPTSTQYVPAVVGGTNHMEPFYACPFRRDPLVLASTSTDALREPYQLDAFPTALSQGGPASEPLEQVSFDFAAPRLSPRFSVSLENASQTESSANAVALEAREEAFYDLSCVAGMDSDAGPLAVGPDGQPSYGQVSSEASSTQDHRREVEGVSTPATQVEGATQPSVSPPSSPRSFHETERTPAPEPAHASGKYYRTPAEKARETRPSYHVIRDGPPPRLSSTLPATADSSVLAYACGHPDCWPDGVSASKARYATSKELSQHNKTLHTEDLGGSTPFRCGLIGCKKSWKSINGLQYHLQVSKVHFQQALATSAELTEEPVVAGATGTSRTAAVNSDSTQSKSRKMHSCPHPGCRNQYKQLSGLRYHLAHGHPTELPVQLNAVPPVLARIVAEKSQRRDPPAE